MQQNDLYNFYINNNECIKIRLITEKDSIEDTTKLLNKAYKALSDMGLKYVATWQDESITRKRIQDAYKCFVGIHQNRIVSTVSIYSPKASANCKWYNNEFVAKFGQFAVLPELQKHGIGSRMMDIVESEAKKINGVKEIALDTAETAYHLIDYYKKRDYRYIETIKWDMTNYRSVVLSKSLK